MFRRQLTNGGLKLVRYFMENRDIENGIESSPKLVESIRNFGGDAVWCQMYGFVPKQGS